MRTRWPIPVVFATTLAFAWGEPSAAGLVPQRDLAKLVDRSPIVVRGTVEYVREAGAGVLLVEWNPQAPGLGLIGRLVDSLGDDAPAPDGSGYPRECPVLVRRAGIRMVSSLKGDAAEPGEIVQVEFYVPTAPVPVHWEQLGVGQHALFFLDGQGSVSDLLYPILPIAAKAPAIEPRLPPLEAVKQHILFSLAPGPPEPTLRSCVQAVIDLKMPEAAERLSRLACASDPLVAGDGLWGLVSLEDRRAFPAAVDFLLATPQGAAAQAGGIMVRIMQLSDPDLAMAVMPLLHSRDPAYRRAALFALRRMKVADTVPAFAYVALHDTDQFNRYTAIMAVGEITGKRGWMTPVDQFDHNPSYYLGLFGEWWAREGAALYGPAE